MSDCCAIPSKADVAKQRTMLWIVLTLNAVMFFVEVYAGFVARSSAVLADSLDMLGDALVYSLSIWSLQKTELWKGRVSQVKGYLMALLALGVIGEAIWKIFASVEIEGSVMMGIGVLALVVNTVCFTLLNRHKKDGINLRSAWICSRNDLLANTGVLIGGLLVLTTSSTWPDIIIALAIGCYVLKSAIDVIRESREETEHHEKCV